MGPFSNDHLDRPVLEASAQTPVEMANLWQKKYPPEEDYPDLSKHNNWVSKCMTPEIYAKLRDKVTPSGCPLDRIIDGRHNGYGKDAKHKTDLNPDNLKGGVFDE